MSSRNEIDLASVGKQIIQPCNHSMRPPELRIFHYSDIYHVDAGSREPVGGAARFQTMHDFYANDKCFRGQPELLTFFSGDSFNPSLESTISKGRHMVPVMNKLGTHAACLGNHDLDFGVPQFVRLAQTCKFPWLCSNVLDPDLGADIPLGGCQKTAMFTASNGVKVGLLGLVEQEWLDTIDHLPPGLVYREPATVAKELAPQLRAQGAEIVIVLTHQRMNNDRRLAEQLQPGTVDIVFGGHDHTYEYAIVNSLPVLRSGSDFKQFSYIEACRHGIAWDFSIVRHDVLSCIPQDEDALKMIGHVTEALSGTLHKVVGCTKVSLDARTATVRKAESNFGNMICDVLRLRYRTDCSIVCGGTIRSDDIYPPGLLRVKDIVNCLPFEDTCVVLELPGSAILAALENGVSQWPSEDGRFPQVSGISFSFDSALPPFARCSSVCIGGCKIVADRVYTMVTRDYMSNGRDGYHMLRPIESGGETSTVQSAEHGIMLSALIRQFFNSLRVIDRWRSFEELMPEHWSHHDERLTAVQSEVSVNDAVRVHASRGSSFCLCRPVDIESDAEVNDAEITMARSSERQRKISTRYCRRWKRIAGLNTHSSLVDDQTSALEWAGGVAISPKVDGRIRILG